MASYHSSNQSELDAFSARVASVKHKQATTPRKKTFFPTEFEQQKRVTLPVKSFNVTTHETVKLPQTPTATALDEIRQALDHERVGSIEVAVRKYQAIAEKLGSHHPSYSKVMERIDIINKQLKGGLSERDTNIPTTPAQLLKSALKSRPAPLLSPSSDHESENESAADISWESPVRDSSPAPANEHNPTNDENHIETDTSLENGNPIPRFDLLALDKETANCELLNFVERQVVDILNTGTAAELILLPGIATKRAQYIIEYREEGEVFESITDLTNIGMNASQVEKLKTSLISNQLGLTKQAKNKKA